MWFSGMDLYLTGVTINCNPWKCLCIHNNWETKCAFFFSLRIKFTYSKHSLLTLFNHWTLETAYDENLHCSHFFLSFHITQMLRKTRDNNFVQIKEIFWFFEKIKILSDVFLLLLQRWNIFSFPTIFQVIM